MVIVKIAAGRSLETAQERLDSDNPGWDFDGVKKQAEAAWQPKIESRPSRRRHGTRTAVVLFDVLSFAFQSASGRQTRRTLSAVWIGASHTADYDRYSPVAFWDTGRDQIVLLMLLEPDLVTNILRTHLEMARESGWMHTSFHGDNAVFLYLGAWERGIPFDWAAVYPFLRKNAIDPHGPRGHLAEYLRERLDSRRRCGLAQPAVRRRQRRRGHHARIQLGRLCDGPLREENWATRTTTKCSSPARIATPTSLIPRIGFMRGRNADGSWISPFDPQEPYYNFMMKEANGWQTLWIVPHDVQGLDRPARRTAKNSARNWTNFSPRRITPKASPAM